MFHQLLTDIKLRIQLYQLKKNCLKADGEFSELLPELRMLSLIDSPQKSIYLTLIAKAETGQKRIHQILEAIEEKDIDRVNVLYQSLQASQLSVLELINEQSKEEQGENYELHS